MASFKKFLTFACVVNTVIMTFFYIIAAFLPESDLVPNLGTMFTVLGFSFVVSGAESVLSSSFSMTGRVICHYILCLGGFMALFVIANGGGNRGSQIIIAGVFFTVLYIIVNLARFIVMGRRAKAENEKLEYTPSFKK